VRRWHFVVYAEGELDAGGPRDAADLARSFLETLRAHGHDVRAAELSELPDGALSLSRDLLAAPSSPDITLESASPERILRHFTPEHVREDAVGISVAFDDLARRIVRHVARGPERTKALNKLLESKDAACRAA